MRKSTLPTGDLYAVIGSPVAHSLSPTMHNCAFSKLGINASYTTVDTGSRPLKETIDQLVAEGYKGWNVTMPNKTEMAEFCDELSEEAQIIGAVNTVKNIDGRLVGQTTDGIGFFRNVKEHGFNPVGKKVVLLGAGGAARSIAVRAIYEDLGELVIYNRTLSKAETLVEMIEKFNKCTRFQAKAFNNHTSLEQDIKTADLLINATPVGMHENRSPLSIKQLPKNLTVADSARRCVCKRA